MRPPDRIAEMRRSAAFRMTLRFAAIFIAGLAILGTIASLAARAGIERSARSDVSETLGRLVAVSSETAPDTFRRTLDGMAAELASEWLSVGLQSPAGALLAGEITLPHPAPGWSDYVADGADADENQWVRTVALPDGSWLSVGASKERYHDAFELLGTGVLWVLATALPLALFSGALLSRMVLKRLDELSRTAEAVRGGDLGRRARLRGTGDEFDRLAGNLNLMLDRSETLTRNLRNVSFGIAHELRTPLARLKHRLEEMRESGSDTGRRTDLIDRSLGDIDETLVTFDALLKIGEIEADMQRSDFESLDLSDLVASLAEIYEPVAAESGRRLAAKIDPGVEVDGNRALLTQMISNLLENALEHTPAGTDITMTLRAGNPSQFTVADNGPGIPAEMGPRIFERFVHGDDRTGGAGLGLALVRSICDLHGFEISLDRQPRGASFLIVV